MNNAIEIKGIDVSLNGFKLKNINLEIPKGVVVGLIGKNGAGKTTLIKTLTDVYLPEKGTISYDGMNMYENAVEIKQKLGIVYDDMYYPANFKAKKIVKMIAPLYHDFDMDKWHKLMEQFGLDENKRPIEYSKGMQMKFMFAMVLAREPEILILDEPTAGMDPAARAEFLEILQNYMMNDENTIIFSTHITSDLDKIADYIAVVSEGELGIYTLIEVVMINSARKNGYYGGIKLSDIVDIFPKYALVFSMIIITIISGILCYKYCVKMLRYDIKGQSTVTNDEAKNLSEFNKMTKANIRGNSFSKKNVIIIMALIGTFAFVFMISGTLGDFYNVDASNKIEQITTNIEDYKNWDMNDEFGWSYSDTSTFIFPEEIDSKNVVSYNAAKYGVKNQNLDKAHRILVQQLSKEQFENERNRIARISYESPVDGKVNYILHDKKHFKNEAYIAIYDDFLYEYAIMDEEKLEIKYLYCYFEKPGIVFKDYNVSPVWTESVISIENANTDLKGYDIRSFYDEENGWYEIMDED